MRRLVIFSHFDKDCIIDDYVVLYLKNLKKIANDIHFVSNCTLGELELTKITPFVQSITLRKNTGHDFGAWKEVILTISLSHIATHYDELILANDSCYAPFFPFTSVFEKMSRKSCDMWGITENHEPHHIYESGDTRSLAPHIQSYFLVFNNAILQSPHFFDYWQSVSASASRDDVIVNYETTLTTALQTEGFYCSAYLSYEKDDLKNLRKIYGRAQHDLSIYYWYELLQRNNPLLKVKAIPSTLRWNKNTLSQFKKKFASENDLCSFALIDKHLMRISQAYRFSKIPVRKKISLLLLYCVKRNKNNVFAIETIKKFKKSISKKYHQGGILLLAKTIFHM